MTTTTISPDSIGSTVTVTVPSCSVSGSLLNGLNGTDTIDISSITTAGSSYNWSQNYGSYSIVNNNNIVKIDGNGLTMQDGCDITVGGKSVLDTLSRIEDRLAILHPNPELEERWENLKGLRRAYMDLEAEIMEKEKMWNILKKA